MVRTVRRDEITDLKFLSGILQQVESAYRETDYTETLKAALGLLEESHSGFFADQSDPNGASWAALKPATVAKKGHSTILVDSKDLRNSLASTGSSAIRESTDRGLIFGTQVPYAIYHQLGTSALPQRAHVGFSKETLDQTLEMIADDAVEALKG